MEMPVIPCGAVMPRIAKRLLMVHQHAHVQTEDGIGSHRLPMGALRMVTDHFEHVVNLSPVKNPDPGELAHIVFLPDNVTHAVLYRTTPLQSPGYSAVPALQNLWPTMAKAWRHVRSVPVIWHAVAEADVVYARLPGFPALLSSILAVLAGKEIMLSLHSDWGETVRVRNDDRLPFRVFAQAVDTCQKYLARRSVLTLVTGSHLCRLGGPRAVVFSQHQFDERDLHRRTDTCQTRPIRLLLVGILSKRKGIQYLLEALTALVDQGVDCTLTLAGPDGDFDARRAIAAHGLASRVTLTGPIEWGKDLFELYRTSDIFVFPSLSEGSPKAPMEALGQSLPVIATPSGSADFISDGVSGLIVPPADASALVQAIRRMIEDDELRRRCIANGYAVAAQNTRSYMSERIGQAIQGAFTASRPA